MYFRFKFLNAWTWIRPKHTTLLHKTTIKIFLRFYLQCAYPRKSITSYPISTKVFTFRTCGEVRDWDSVNKLGKVLDVYNVIVHIHFNVQHHTCLISDGKFNYLRSIVFYSIVLVSRCTLEPVIFVQHVHSDDKNRSVCDCFIDQISPLVRRLWVAFCWTLYTVARLIGGLFLSYL